LRSIGFSREVKVAAAWQNERKGKMNQILELPSDVYRKLAEGAARRGMTIESLLVAVSDLVVLPDQPTDQERQRCRLIDKLLDRMRAGRLAAKDREQLDQLIDADYQAANARADRLIAAKLGRKENGPLPRRKPNGTSRPAKPSRS
jgi:hypothetical protein